MGGDPDEPAYKWSRAIRNGDLFVSATTVGEVEAATQQIPPNEAEKRRRYEHLLNWGIPQMFGRRLLEIDLQIAREWGRVKQRVFSMGVDVSPEEAMEIAIARVSGYQYVAREEPHHAELGIIVVDPWNLSA